MNNQHIVARQTGAAFKLANLVELVIKNLVVSILLDVNFTGGDLSWQPVKKGSIFFKYMRYPGG
jgi:hypothetical protein